MHALRYVLVALLVAGCAMGPRMQNVRPGMTQQDVVELLGEPDGMTVEGDYRALQWANRLVSGWSNDRADYWVVLVEDSVTAYGPGSIRPGPRPNTLILVPLQPPR